MRHTLIQLQAIAVNTIWPLLQDEVRRLETLFIARVAANPPATVIISNPAPTPPQAPTSSSTQQINFSITTADSSLNQDQWFGKADTAVPLLKDALLLYRAFGGEKFRSFSLSGPDQNENNYQVQILRTTFTRLSAAIVPGMLQPYITLNSAAGFNKTVVLPNSTLQAGDCLVAKVALGASWTAARVDGTIVIETGGS